MIRKAMGWCPNAASLNNNGKIDMISYEGKFIDKIKNIGSREILSFLHLVFGVWLIITALRVLAKPQFFPWWFMEINIISSGILLVIGVSSLMIFFNFFTDHEQMKRNLNIIWLSPFIIMCFLAIILNKNWIIWFRIVFILCLLSFSIQIILSHAYNNAFIPLLLILLVRSSARSG